MDCGGFRGGVEGVLEGIWAVYYVNFPLCRSLQFWALRESW